MDYPIKEIASNKKAYHDYFIEEKFEAGIELTGTEIKSIRKGNVNLKDSYAYIKDGELFISHMHISPYEQGNIFNVDPIRDRRLLVTKREINKLIGLIKQQGLTLVPINLYFKGKWAKLTIGIGKGKKLYDKRQDIAKRSAEKEMAIRLKEKQQM
ncbi:MAG: SsrA-binding protein SmpB [Clostridiales bacterium]|nr:SsrA-binding protein SmpB [Clostridiales bacterium]